MDKRDAYILRNLRGLVRAAKVIHTAASSAGFTVYAKSSPGGTSEDNDGRYAESGIMGMAGPVAVPEYARYIQMLRRVEKPPTQNGRGPHFDDAPELWRPPASPALLRRCRAVTNYTTNAGDTFDNIFSPVFEKMTQRALHLFDFAKPETVLSKAISSYKVRDADDTYHSQLRIQHALCCFLQGRGFENAEAIEDLAQFRGTDQAMANRLRYALALCHVHELNHEATKRLCMLLW